LIAHYGGNNANYVLINKDLINFKVYMSDTRNNRVPTELSESQYFTSVENFGGINFTEVHCTVTEENRQSGDKVFIDIRLLNIAGVNNVNFENKRMRRFTIAVKFCRIYFWV
jgi:hypothetical protein